MGEKKGLIMTCCCALLILACKTKNSHVQKSALESVTTNREYINNEFVAMSSTVQHTSLQIDSSYLNGIVLKNFSGSIYPDGKVQGLAEQANISQSGSKEVNRQSFSKNKDTLSRQQVEQSDSQTAVKIKEYDRQKERKGIAIPWWMWIPLIAIVMLIVRIVKRS